MSLSDLLIIIVYSIVIFIAVLWIKGYRFHNNDRRINDNISENYDHINATVDEAIRFMKNTVGIKSEVENIIRKKLQYKCKKENNSHARSQEFDWPAIS